MGNACDNLRAIFGFCVEIVSICTPPLQLYDFAHRNHNWAASLASAARRLVWHADKQARRPAGPSTSQCASRRSHIPSIRPAKRPKCERPLTRSRHRTPRRANVRAATHTFQMHTPPPNQPAQQSQRIRRPHRPRNHHHPAKAPATTHTFQKHTRQNPKSTSAHGHLNQNPRGNQPRRPVNSLPCEPALTPNAETDTHTQPAATNHPSVRVATHTGGQQHGQEQDRSKKRAFGASRHSHQRPNQLNCLGSSSYRGARLHASSSLLARCSRRTTSTPRAHHSRRSPHSPRNPWAAWAAWALYCQPHFSRESSTGLRLRPSGVSEYSTRGGTSA